MYIAFVEDTDVMKRTLETVITLSGFEPLYFPTGSACMNYLMEREKYDDIAAYLVDMRIPDDLPGSENLYNYVTQIGEGRKFRFITGNLSDHDLGVGARTGAKIIRKGDIDIERLIKDLYPNP